MENRVLKRTKGLLYFFIATVFFYFNLRISNKAWHRLLICFIYSFIGLGIKGIYECIKKHQEKEEQIINCTVSFIYNGWAILAVTSFIYLVSYENFQKVDSIFFNLLSLLIFSYSGFIINEIMVLPF